jgi:hypothetical protein
MCPACLAAVSMIVAGVVSAGGVTVLAAKTHGKRKRSEPDASAVGTERKVDGESDPGRQGERCEGSEPMDIQPEDWAEFVLMGA